MINLSTIQSRRTNTLKTVVSCITREAKASMAFGFDLVTLGLGLLVFAFFWKIVQSNEKTRQINKIPGPFALPFVGNLQLLEPREEALNNIMKRQQEFGPVIRFWLGSRAVVIFSDPDDIEVLLKSSKHSEKAFSYKFLHSWLGTGLLTSHGKKWATHRKLITPTFHFKILQNFVDVFHQNATILAEKLERKAETGEEFDLYAFVTLCTLDIICETAMGTKVNAQSEVQNEYVQSVYSLSSLVVYRINRVWLYPDFFFQLSSAQREYQQHLDRVQGFTKNVIKTRKEVLKKKKESEAIENDEERKKNTFLDLLLEISMEGGSSLLTDEEIREEVETFMFEGHDTTSAGISWAMALLCEHPKIQEKCYEELKAIFEDDTDRIPTLTDLAEMKLLERVIKESLRLYPSVISIGRIIEEDVRFGKYLIPKGTDAVIPIYALHRNPKNFPEPEVFDPDRFLPENSSKRHPYAYVPFSAGPRNCIGQKFALYEEKIILSTLLRRYKFQLVEPLSKITKIPDLVLRPGAGIRMKAFRR